MDEFAERDFFHEGMRAFQDELAGRRTAEAIEKQKSCPFSCKEWMSKPIQLPALHRKYDWKHIFKSKYAAERCCRKRTCTFVGCLYVVRRADHFNSHILR